MTIWQQVKYLLFVVARLVYLTVDTILTRTVRRSLVYGSAEESRKFDRYETGAHVTRVVAKAAFIQEFATGHQNFILGHEDYVHPRIVLEKPNTTLYHVLDDRAVFVVCDRDVTSNKHGPFIYTNQFKFSHHLVTMKLEHFLRMVRTEAVSTDHLTLVHLANTGRCGSTMLTTALENVSNSISLSEPMILLDIMLMMGTKDEKTLDEIMKAAIDCTIVQACSNHPNVENVVLKPQSQSICLTEDLARIYPKMKHLYMFRHPVGYTQSAMSMMSALGIVGGLFFKSLFYFNVMDIIQLNFKDRTTARARSFRKLTLKYLWNNLAWAAIHFTANLLSLKEILESSPNIDFFFLSYEELKENYDTVVKSITKFCELPVVASETELRIPGDDSQKNSWLSRENLAKHKTNLNAEDIAKVDAVLEDCDLPKCSVFPVRGADLMKIIAKGRQ